MLVNLTNMAGDGCAIVVNPAHRPEPVPLRVIADRVDVQDEADDRDEPSPWRAAPDDDAESTVSRTRHHFTGRTGVVEVDVIVADVAAWGLMPESTDPRWNVVRLADGRTVHATRLLG